MAVQQPAVEELARSFARTASAAFRDQIDSLLASEGSTRAAEHGA